MLLFTTCVIGVTQLLLGQKQIKVNQETRPFKFVVY